LLGIMLTTSPPSLLERLRGPWRILLKEVAAFGVVGAAALVIDIGLFNLLLHQDVGVLTSKGISTGVATTFAYLGNRHWSFSHRARTGLARETSFFFGINLVALVGAELILALFAYPLGYKYDHWVMNLVNLATIALGTLFRFWGYKRFVFLHPDKVHSPAADLDEELAEG
jgi:putative flippase GtrA